MIEAARRKLLLCSLTSPIPCLLLVPAHAHSDSIQASFYQHSIHNKHHNRTPDHTTAQKHAAAGVPRAPAEGGGRVGELSKRLRRGSGGSELCG